MSQSAKKEAFSRAKTRSRLISWRAEKLHLEFTVPGNKLPQAKKDPNMGFDGFSLQVVKGRLKENQGSAFP